MIDAARLTQLRDNFWGLMLDKVVPRLDSRDAFSIDTTRQQFDRLVSLDPTGFAPLLYLSALVGAAARVGYSFSLDKILFDEPSKAWCERYRLLIADIDADLAEPLSNFRGRIEASLSRLGVEGTLSDLQLATLLRDALASIAGMRQDWLRTDGAPAASGGGTFSRKLWLFDTLADLHDALLSDFPIGAAMVGVKTAKGKHEDGVAGTTVLVMKQPGRILLCSNLRYDLWNSRMISGNAGHFSPNIMKLDHEDTRFPNWGTILPKGALVPEGNNLGLPVMDLGQLPLDQVAWTLMLFELMGQDIAKEAPPQKATYLAAVTGESRTTLPAVWVPPFQFAAPCLDEIIRASRLETSINAELYLGYARRVDPSKLYPIKGKVPNGLSLVSLMPEPYQRPDPYVRNRADKAPTHALMLTVSPDLFGSEEFVHAAVLEVAAKNLLRVVSAMAERDYFLAHEALEGWFKKRLNRRRIEQLVDRVRHAPYTQVRAVPEKGLDRYFVRGFFRNRGNGIGYVPLTLRPMKDSDPHEGHVFYEQSPKHQNFKPMDYLTGQPASQTMIIRPMDWRDLCDLLEVKQNDLPPLLQSWHRTESYSKESGFVAPGAADGSRSWMDMLSATVYLS